MTPESNLEKIRRALSSGPEGADALFALLDDDVEWDYVGAFPESATYYGPEAVRRFFAQWSGAFEGFGFEPEEFVDGGEHVVVLLRQWGRGKATGVPVENRTWQVFTFREGRIVHCRGYPEKAEALKAAGLGPAG